MSNCSLDNDTLILAASKELSWVKRIGVLRHIQRCENCRKLFWEYKNMSGLLRKLPDNQLQERIIKDIENKTGVKSGEPSLLEDLLSIIFYSRVKLAGATAIVVVIIAVILFRNNFPEMNTTKTDQYYSASEINLANIKTKEAFAILGKFLNKTQVQLESEILGKKVSDPLNKGIHTVNEIFNKGDKNENN